MTFKTALALGRVSNLPTVWSNVVVGVALAGAPLAPATVLPMALAMSLLYVAGMYLNDAFDARWDAEHRAERPIPRGEVTARTVFLTGFGMLLAGVGLVGITASLPALAAAAALAALIVLYDVTHKWNPAAPLVMALCRVGVYATAGAALAWPLPPRLWAAAGGLLLYLVAVSLLAKREAREPRLRSIVGRLIAGIALYDAALLAMAAHHLGAALAALAFVLTRRWQRHVPGT